MPLSLAKARESSVSFCARGSFASVDRIDGVVDGEEEALGVVQAWAGPSSA